MKEKTGNDIDTITIKNIIEIITLLSFLLCFKHYFSVEELTRMLGQNGNNKMFQSLMLYRHVTLPEDKIGKSQNKEESNHTVSSSGDIQFTVLMTPLIGIISGSAVSVKLFSLEITAFSLVIALSIYHKSRRKRNKSGDVHIIYC